MKSTFLKSDDTHTAFVQLNTYDCTACWECIKVCPNKVIDKSFIYIVGTLIHEHVLMYEATDCVGCKKCLQTCEFNAISSYKKY
jgi:2-oxoglutarate ferredoxin oxidoreductase subunit delta